MSDLLPPSSQPPAQDAPAGGAGHLGPERADPLGLRDRQILILGLGHSGLAMARWCARQGAAGITVADTRIAPPQAAALAQELPSVQQRCGAFDGTLVEGVDLLLKSPGLAPGDAQVAAVLAAAAQRGVPVHGELALFARALADLKRDRGYAPKVLAITGTNGKTTTTAMTALLAERAGARVAMAGNIGPTLLDTLAQALDLEPLPADTPPTVLADPAPPAEEAAGADEELADATTLETQAVDSPVDLEPAAEAAVSELAPADPTLADATPADPAPAETDDPRIGGGPPAHLIPPPPAAPKFEHLPEVWVLELSSFQLDGVEGFEPTAAAVLNVTQDHLDWHGSMAAYAAAKARIHGQRALMVINRDDALVEAMVPPPQVILTKGRGKGRSRTVHRPVVRFGMQAPTQPGDFGLLDTGGMTWLVRARPLHEVEVGTEGLQIQRLMPADALRVRGRHNAANALAALALATAADLPLAPMLHGLRDYAGEPHRVELLGCIAEVEAYDDSKGTNVGATVAAITGLGADKAPAKLVLILGGDGKGQDFAPLAAPALRYARAVALIGRDAAAIEHVLHGSPLLLQRHDSLEAATRWCFEQAQPGDAVLLSPACASLDMFRNYAHRAQVFADTVKALALDHGELVV